MVHALESCRRLLRPGGYLVDIHPGGEPPPIEMALGEQHILLGHLQESDDFIEYAQADAALAQAVQMGLFTWQRREEFTFTTICSSVAELRAYLEENWGNAILNPEIDAREGEILARATPTDTAPTVILSERVRIARLQPT